MVAKKPEQKEVVEGSGMFHEEGKRVYRIEFINGSVKLVKIPDDWKITFSAFQPGSKDRFANGSPTLRMYETESKQRAVFRDVLNFMDMSIEVLEQVIDIESNSSVKHDDGFKRIESGTEFTGSWQSAF